MPVAGELSIAKSICSKGELLTEGASKVRQVAPKDTPSEPITRDVCGVLKPFPLG